MSRKVELKHVETLREITLIFGNHVLLVVLDKKISIQNIFARIGYYTENEHFRRCSTIPPIRITTFYTCYSVIGNSYLFPLPIDEDKCISFLEIINAETKSAHYILLKVAEYLNPYCLQKQKYVEVIKEDEIRADQNDDFLNRVSRTSYDVLGEPNLEQTETNVLCESMPIMTQHDDPVWVPSQSDISLAWSHSIHWETVTQQFGTCSDNTAWVVYDSYQIITSANRVTEDMLVKSICNLTLIKDDENPICTPKHIALLPSEAFQLAIMMVLRAILNRPKQGIKIIRQSFGPGNVFMHVTYERLYDTKDLFHVLKNPKLASRIGLSKNYIQYITSIMGITEGNQYFYVQNAQLLQGEPQMSTIETVCRQLASLENLIQFEDLYQEKLSDLIQQMLRDVVFKVFYDGEEMVVTSDILPEHTILFSPCQEIEMNIANSVLFLAEKSPLIFSYVKLNRNT